jgi:hypothetical protein
MSARAPIYTASPLDTAEVLRALRICLAGTLPPAALTFGGGDFAAWTQQVFLPVLAPHAVRSHGMALGGDAAGLTEADGSLRLPPPSAEAGRKLLESRKRARQLPAARRFVAAVAAGGAPGHFATVMALQAAEFSVAVLPLLQCLLFCEWRTGRPDCTAPDFEDFLDGAENGLRALPSVLVNHANYPDIPFARVV